MLDLIPPDQEFSIEREVFPRLVGNGLYSQRLEGYWMDIGTPERYLQASWDILERRVETEPGGDGRRARPLRRRRRRDRRRAPSVGESVFVESAAPRRRRRDARPARGRSARAARSARAPTVSESVLHRNCEIDPGAEVQRLDPRPERPRRRAARWSSPDCVIGQGAAIDPGADVPAGSRIEPAEEVA